MNLMKIVTYLLGALLAAALGAAALFYFSTFQPMATEYARMKPAMPELDRAKAELKKYKEKEAKTAAETAWISPAVTAASAELASEIKEGKAEVTAAGNAVVVNIAENSLYTPESKIFAKDTQTRMRLTALLKRDELKGKDFLIGNVAEAVAARGRGRKRVPAKDALTLASERSVELVKALIREGVTQEALAAVAYPGKPRDHGFKIKSKKTMILIGAFPAAPANAAIPAVPGQQPVAAPAVAPQQVQPKAIPRKPAQPKTH